MTAHIEQQTARSAGWAYGTACFSAVLFATSALSHRFGFLETPGLIAVLALVAALAVLALVFAVISFPRVWNRGDHGGRNIAKGVIIALLVLVPFAVFAYRGYTHPDLNDISTDTFAPPLFANAGQVRTLDMNPITPAFSAAAARLQAESYPEVVGRRYEMPIDRVLNAVLALVEERGWQIVESPATALMSPEMTVEAVATTLVLALPSDVAIRLTDEGASTYVDMRSASRYGQRDFGDNAERIDSFLDELDAAMAAQVGVVPAE
ncbi:MAG: DUF1499 domain-containing protein [Mesorhizobium sp.]|jgi:Protein of unknown function (DUF1499)